MSTVGRRVVVSILIATSLLPLSGASGVVEIGPVRVIVENGHEEACIEDTSGLCPVEMRGGSLDSTYIDADQRLRFVGVTANGSFVNDAISFPLLPDETILFDLWSLSRPHPVFRVLVENVGSPHGPGALSDFGVIFTRDGWGFDYFGPEALSSNTTLGRHGFYTGYPEKGGLGYDHIEPVGFGNTSTDERTGDAFALPCLVLESTECMESAAYASSIWAENAPNLQVGADFYRGGLSTSPSGFGVAAASGGRGDAELPPYRSSATTNIVIFSPEVPIPRLQGPQVIGAPHREPEVPREEGPENRSLHPPEPRRSTGDTLPPPALAAYAAAFVVAILLSVLSSRITPAQAMQSTRRAELMALLGERGPQTIAALARALGVDRTTVEHHVQVLERTGHARLSHSGRNALVALPSQNARVSCIPSPIMMAIVDIIRNAGGSLSREELHGRAHAISQRSRNHALQRLTQIGIVESTSRDGVDHLLLRLPSQ